MRRVNLLVVIYRFLSLLFLLWFFALLLVLGDNTLQNGGSVAAQSRSAPISPNTTCTPTISGVTGKVTVISPLNIQIDISLQANDCGNGTNSALIQFLDGQNQLISSFTAGINPPLPPGARNSTVTGTVSTNGDPRLLGSCMLSIALVDNAGNRSNSGLISFRSCTLPIIGQAQVSVIDGDRISLGILGGDPDSNTNQILYDVRNSSGSLGNGTFDITQLTFGRSSFSFTLTLKGISTLSSPPNLLRVQLMDAQGNDSSQVDLPFTPIKGTPRLLVASLMLNPPSATPGSMVEVDLTITNGGDAPAPSSTAEIRLSDDTTINSNDTLLATLSVSALNPGDRATGSTMVTIPQNTPGGNYFIGVIAGGGNTQSRPLTVVNAADTVSPTVQVLTPKAGDMVAAGGTLHITYVSKDNVGVVSHSIDLSTDGGRTFSPIAQGLGGSVQQFDFAVPQDFSPATTQAVVRVTARDAAGNSGVGLSDKFTIGDLVPPTVQLIAPRGGETLTAGTPFNIQFMGADNDALAGFTIAYSTDGGATFPGQNQIGQVGATATSIIWNVPDLLQTTQGRIQVTARDRSGNTASAVSGIFTVQKPPSTAPVLQVMGSFDPPPPGQIAPPQNVRVNASEIRTIANFVVFADAESKGTLVEKFDLHPDDANAPTLLGYNIYRVPEPPQGQPQPTPEQIVSDPTHLVDSILASSTTFMDSVSTSKGDNFLYSITSFFGNGQMSGGSTPAGTSLPVIKNQVFRQGTIFFDAAGSFIAPSGAVLIVNDSQSYPLQFDTSGAFFTVPKKTPGSPGNITIKKLVKKGSTVRLVVKNPDGKFSVGVTLKRS